MANKILVLPDIHGRKFWRKALEKHMEEVDLVVALGDYHDPYYDDEGITYKSSLVNMRDFFDFANEHKDKIVRLLGNHDLHYIDETVGKSSRYDEVNAKYIRQLLMENLESMKIAHEAEIEGKKYLFTHAGLCKSWVKTYGETIGELAVENLNKLPYTKEGLVSLGAYSKYRGWGGEKTGSVIWSDVRERILTPTENYTEFFQVFGHTRSYAPIVTDNWAMLDSKEAFLIDNEGIKKITESGTKVLEKTQV